jgi:hypothetical protein
MGPHKPTSAEALANRSAGLRASFAAMSTEDRKARSAKGLAAAHAATNAQWTEMTPEQRLSRTSALRAAANRGRKQSPEHVAARNKRIRRRSSRLAPPQPSRRCAPQP